MGNLVSLGYFADHPDRFSHQSTKALTAVITAKVIAVRASGH